MSTPDPNSPPPGVSRAEYAAHLEQMDRRAGQRSTNRGDGIEFSELVAMLGTLPPETPAEKALREKAREDAERAERMARFRKLCPVEFMQKANREMLMNPAAFDRVAKWNGVFPGPIAVGVTGTSKTRAAWSVIGRLTVEEKRATAWFPVKRLITEFARYESRDLADEFWRFYRGYNVLFVDDLDKINWQFESEGAALFQFYDWIYRDQRACITTTNKNRAWWADKMGDAFARRLFDDAHFEVNFSP